MFDTKPDTAISRILPRRKWREQKRQHEERISSKIDGYLEKRSRQQKNPVVDFLFEYYRFRPSHLKTWSPGLGTLLEDVRPGDELSLEGLVLKNGEAFLDPCRFPGNRLDSLHWILNLLEQTAKSDPHFGCFGMHEWAMVYKAGEVRHDHLPLRMEMDDLAEFVESRPLVCTHFDAFRFFTKEARPMNRFRLSRERFREMEQPGCIHTNMDIYKWAFKMHPWISSRLVADAFELAWEAREIDMKASPYDLRNHGLEPIRIETEEGRHEYLKQQRHVYKKGEPIRDQLIEAYRRLTAEVENTKEIEPGEAGTAEGG